jgi:hypothetical protein
MKITTRVLLSACLSFSAAGAFAADASRAAGEQTMNKDWTIEQCRSFMANRPSGASRDDSAMSKESRCSEMMKNEQSGRNGHSTATMKDSADDPKVMKKDWTIQECRDRMTRPNRENAKQDQDSMTADRHCADLMKRDRAATTGNSSTDSTRQ